jgi:hypothetical protein
MHIVMNKHDIEACIGNFLQHVKASEQYNEKYQINDIPNGRGTNDGPLRHHILLGTINSVPLRNKYSIGIQ